MTSVTSCRKPPGGASGHRLAVYTLPKHLDEKVAAPRLAKVGAKLTRMTPEQAKYLGVTQNGPFKAESFRY